MATISPVAGNALLGIQRGMNGLRENAAEIASAERLNGTPPAGTRDVAAPLVESRANARQVEASVKVLAAEDRLLGSLLDVRA
ncbi:MAG: hypothetical protein LPK58_01105 [Gammaproteobacteria bacterium]|nr:hypothetical protein [Gammaproteobacteria bacterium]MDX5374339.1 hypothetical protein [Gammaproteobacteria bacterium]